MLSATAFCTFVREFSPLGLRAGWVEEGTCAFRATLMSLATNRKVFIRTSSLLAMKIQKSRQKPVTIKPFSKREAERRGQALKRVFAEIDADPALKADIKKFIQISLSRRGSTQRSS